MKALTRLAVALSFPLMLLNLLSGIVSGTWLAVLRDWSAIGLGVGSVFLSTLILGIVLMPSLLLAAPAAYFAEKGKTLGLIFSSGLAASMS